MSDVRALVEAAYRRAMSGWELKRGNAAKLQGTVDLLAVVAVRGAVGRREPFGEVGRKTARRELDALAAAADAMVARVKALHAPAIDALAIRGVMYARVERWARAVAEEARAASVSKVPETAGKGRPKDNLAGHVAAIVIRDFERMTRGRLDLPADSVKGNSRGLVPLVQEVLAALAIKADAKAAVVAALAAREQRRKPRGRRKARGTVQSIADLNALHAERYESRSYKRSISDQYAKKPHSEGH